MAAFNLKPQASSLKTYALRVRYIASEAGDEKIYFSLQLRSKSAVIKKIGNNVFLAQKRGMVSMAGAGLITALLGFVTSHNPMLVMGVYLLLALLLLLLWWVPVFASQEQKACLDRV